jgi:arylsulfatase A-like enzyme
MRDLPWFPRRRQLPAVLILAALSAAGIAGVAGAAVGGEPPAGKPNILFILADDLGVGDLSSYGAPQIRTPSIDRIAADGMRFSRAYANSAVCTASRVGLITGRYQYRLAVGLEEPLGPGNDVGLPPEQPTLPSLLRKAGYDTWLIGKWHLGALPKFGPQQSGYDHFYGFRGGALDYFTHKFLDEADFWEDAHQIEQPGYLTTLLGERAIEVIRQHRGSARPFFVSLHFNAPHWPWEGPGDAAVTKQLSGWQLVREWGSLPSYNAMVEAMDHEVGRLLEALQQTGQADNTIVIFTSDNGGERYSYTWPFTGKKSELLEGGLRIPAMIRWPRHVPAGVVSAQTIILMDWLPTLTAAAGGAPDPAFPSDGLNLLPVLTQGAPSVPRRLFWRFKANAQRAVLDGDYKAVKIGANGFLFNIAEDSLERANLKSRFPEIYKRLTQEWNEWNRSMLPESPASSTYSNSGNEWADHVGSPEIDKSAIDDGGPWPQ